jgi:uncharacterized membrane protein YphA (DoxX/SURF4 family)
MANKKRSGKKPPPPAHWTTKVGPWARIALGVMFVVAGGSKAIDPWSFLSALGSYGVPEALKVPIAVTLPSIELVVGVMLLFGWATRLASSAAAVMLVGFIAAIGYGSWLGSLEECGCFGPFIQRSPGEAALIDLVMLGLAGLVWWLSRDARPTLQGWRSLTVAGLGLAAIAVAAVNISAGPTGLAAVAAGDGESGGAEDMRSVDLQRGEHLLYLFHYECPHCAEMSPRVAEYTKDPSLPPVVGITFRTPKSVLDNYLAKYGMSIPAQVLPPQQFISITGEGAVPQLVHLRDGEIVRTWLGLLPEAAELRRELGDGD